MKNFIWNHTNQTQVHNFIYISRQLFNKKLFKNLIVILKLIVNRDNSFCAIDFSLAINYKLVVNPCYVRES